MKRAILLCFSFFIFAINAKGLCAQVPDEKEDLIIISPSSHNFFFHSIQDKLFKNAGYDYVPVLRPTNRAIREVNGGLLNIGGPYARSMFDFHFIEDDIVKLRNGKWMIRWEDISYFAVQLDNQFSFTTLQDLKDLRIGYLRNHFKPKIRGNQHPILAKSLEQIAVLLKSGRIDVALLSGRQSMELMKISTDSELSVGKRAIYTEKQYLYLSPTNDDFVEHFFEALNELKRTDFYKVRLKKYGEFTKVPFVNVNSLSPGSTTSALR